MNIPHVNVPCLLVLTKDLILILVAFMFGANRYVNYFIRLVGHHVKAKSIATKSPNPYAHSTI
jgi:hypothetical protein